MAIPLSNSYLLKSLVAAAAIQGNTDRIPLMPRVPGAQQSGEFRLAPWSILREPGNPRAYTPGRHPAGTTVKFQSGTYKVGPAGNLIRA